MNIHDYMKVIGSTAEEFRATGLESTQLFPWQILKQNRMYDLPVNEVPTLDDLGESPVSRLEGFIKTLEKEVKEGVEILAVVVFREWKLRNVTVTEDAMNGLLDKFNINDVKRRQPLVEFMAGFNASNDLVELDREILVMLGDWLGDINVYIRSEATKFGLPHEAILACIMGSNFTKLGADGLPIKDENGKFLKGPNFIPPERHIYATMFQTEELIAEANAETEKVHNMHAIALPALVNPMSEVFEKEFGEDGYEEADEEAYDDTVDENEEDEVGSVFDK